VKAVVAIENVAAAINQIARVAGRRRAGQGLRRHDGPPVALQLRNLQTLVEIGVERNTTIVFPAPLMSTIEELGTFPAREKTAAAPLAGLPAAVEPARNGGAAAPAAGRKEA
jgi:hypothetical protein